jgi:hypothetical protein
MTKTERAREQWQLVYKQHGKGSKEEIVAYREYVAIQQGQGKCKSHLWLTKKK